MPEELKSLLFAAILTAVFFFAIVNFGVTLTNNNNVNNTLLDNSVFNETFNSLENNLSNVQDTAQGQRENFEEETPIIGTDAFLFTSIIGAAKTFGSMMIKMYDLTFGLLGQVLGISPIIIGVFTGMLLILLIFLTWRFIKTGR